MGQNPRDGTQAVPYKSSVCFALAVIAAGRRGQCRTPYRKSGGARSTFDSLAPGTAGNQKPSMRTGARSHVFYSTADEYQLRQFVSGDSPQKSARLCALFFDFVQVDGFTTE